MFNYHSLITLFPLSNLEKTTICVLIAAILSFLVNLLNSINKKRRKSRMHKDLIYLTEYKWNDLINILTFKNHINHSDIQDTLQIDFKKFDSKYKNILYQELYRIKNYYDINPHNWKTLVNMIFEEGKETSIKKVSC